MTREEEQDWPRAAADLRGLARTYRGRSPTTARQLEMAVDLADREWKRSRDTTPTVIRYQLTSGGRVDLRMTLKEANTLRRLLPDHVEMREE